MTKVYAKLDAGRFELSACGHATGSEKVCAAVSAIVYALAGYIANAEAAGRAWETIIQTEDGDAWLRCCGDKRAEAAFEMAVIGLQQVEKQYPDFIRVKLE